MPRTSDSGNVDLQEKEHIANIQNIMVDYWESYIIFFSFKGAVSRYFSLFVPVSFFLRALNSNMRMKYQVKDGISLQKQT